MDDHDDAAAAVPPVGWYPDPSGEAQWRRWDGATWSDATMPYGPAAPDTFALSVERTMWHRLRALGPWGLVAPAAGAAAFASQSSGFGAFRRWLRAYLRADLHHQTLPASPVVNGSTSTLVSITNIVSITVAVVGVMAWLRFALAASRVAGEARYPVRHHWGWACGLLFVPFVGPFFASSASKEWLPAGHEARRTLDRGWALVALGELASFAVFVTVLATSSIVAAWIATGACAAIWVTAAIELPRGFEAIADDHEALGARLTSA